MQPDTQNMKKLTMVSITRDQCEANNYAALVRIFPAKYWETGIYTAKLPTESQEMQAILKLLHNLGLAPWRDTKRDRLPSEYSIEQQINFERRDFLKARFLIWFPNHSLMDVADTTAAGKIVVNTDPLDMAEVEPRTVKALFAGDLHLAVEGKETIVSEPFREVIEAAKLIGLQYEDRVEFIGSQASKVPHQYWVLRTNLVMPPVSPKTPWVDKHGNPCEDHTLPGSHIAEAEVFRYEADALKAMGEFDAAIQCESDPKCPNWIMSQRFYQLCLKHKAPLVVEPVEIV